MAGFFGPSGLNNDPGAALTGSQEDPQQAQMRQFLLRSFPGLAGLAGGQSQAPSSLAGMGYSFPGVDLFAGQQFGGTPPSLSLFETSASGSSPDSLTGAIATGQARSSSIQPLGSTPGANGVVSAPQLALPGAPTLPSFGDTTDMGSTTTFGPSSSSSSGPASAEIGSLGQAAGLAFKLGSTATGSDSVIGTSGLPLTQSDIQGSSPTAFQQQRAGERTDYTTATGSPSGIPQGTTALQLPAGTTQNQLSPEQINAMLTDWTNGMNGGALPTGMASGADLSALIKQSDQGLQGAGELANIPGLNAAGQLSGDTSWTGAGLGALNTLGGLMNTYGGIQSGNPLTASMGGLQTIGGLASVLRSSPDLMNMIADQLGTTGSAVSGVASGVGGAVGGIGGLYSLYQGIQTGDPLQIATGLVSAYQGGSALAGQLLGQALPSITSALTTGIATIAPEAAMSIATAFGGEAATAAATAALEAGSTAVEATSAALSASIGGIAGAAAPIIMAIVSYISAMEEKRVREAGFTNNPIEGQLYSNSTAGVQNAQNQYDALTKASNGDLSGLSTMQIADAITGMGNSLMPYYATAEGGAGPLRASTSLTGLFGRPGLGGVDQYIANFNNAQQGLVSLVNELMRRGVPYEEIGQLPVSNDWGLQTNDMSNPAQALYGLNGAKWNAEAQQMLNQAMASPVLQRTGLNNEILMYQNPNYIPGQSGEGLSSTLINPADWTPEALFAAAGGAAAAAPDEVTHAGGLLSSMYGGPIWQAMARMGIGSQEGSPNAAIWQAIQQHFDPWANARTETPNQILATMGVPVDVSHDSDALYANDWKHGLSLQDAARQGLWDPYWTNVINQGASQAGQQTQQSFADLQSQLQDYLAQLQAAGVPGMAGQPTGQPAAPTAPVDWASAWATMTPQQQATYRSAGMDPTLLAQMNWLNPVTA